MEQPKEGECAAGYSEFPSFLHCVLPDLPDVLIDSRHRERIRNLAAQLGPSYWAGFETRLDSNARVDFHQGFRLGGEDGPRFLASLAAALPTEQSSLVKVLRDQCAQLPNPFDHAVLEFDLLGDGALRAPGLFLAFKHPLTSQERATMASRLLAPFDFAPSLGGWVEQVFRSSTGQAQVSHLGVMLGRSLDVVRLNVRGVTTQRLPSFLSELAFTGPLDAACAQHQRFSRLVDRVNVCLDVGTDGARNLGLECVQLRAPHDEPRYEWLALALTEAGACLPEKLAALSLWPGTLTPCDRESYWPEELLFASLQRPADDFSMIRKNLAHFKLSFNEHGELSAKAYLGFEHIWRTPHSQPPRPAEHPRHSLILTPTSTCMERLQESISRAGAFLCTSRHQSGWWRDYPDAAIGPSDEWVTAYVGLALSTVPGVEAKAAAREAWSQLERNQRPEGGWGWGLHTAADADTTIWATLLARALGARDEPIRDAIAFLQRHRHPSGGFSTYEASYFKAFHRGGAGVGETLDEWFEPHACVTAAALSIEEFRSTALAYLKGVYDSEGRLPPSYWWRDASFATALAAHHFANSTDKWAAEVRARALTSTRRFLDVVASRPQLTPFVASHHLDILLAARPEPEPLAEQLINYLLRTQNGDGSWPASAVLLPNGRRFDRTVLDVERNHTTATVLRSLGRTHDLLTT